MKAFYERKKKGGKRERYSRVMVIIIMSGISIS
jgi:hypothetical protein